MDKIFIRDLRVETVIGIYEWERRIRQTVVIDLELSADIRKAALSDAIEDTVSYKGVAKRVIEFVEQSEFQLIETLSERIAEIVLTEFGLQWVKLTLSKPRAVRGVRDVGVIIERSLGDAQ
jgi:dihydroneopterin aldolase